MDSMFEKPATGLLGGCFLAKVSSVDDPENLSRVQVRIFNADDVTGHDAPIWARVAVPFAGGNRGAFLIPSVDDEVLVTFVNGDARYPIIIGSLWNGSQKAPEQLSGNSVDRWTFVGKNGTRIAIVEESNGQETISLTTPQKRVSATLTAESGGKLQLKTPTATVTLDTGGVSVDSTVEVSVQAATQCNVTAPMVKIDAVMVECTGVVKCMSLIATNVLGTIYSPGIGNLW